MPHTQTKTVFDFDELSDEAKERARQDWRETNLDYEWWDMVYEDAAQIADILGIDLRAGKTDDKGMKIFFSGFSSQGDGACFEGHYAYAKGCAKKIRAYAPKDIELHRIADALVEAQRSANYGLSATMKHRGHYYHARCMDVDVDVPISKRREEEACAKIQKITDELKPDWVAVVKRTAQFKREYWKDVNDAEQSVIQCMRDFADWIYKTLERKHDWLQDDEQIDESIKANECEFTEEGRTA